MSGIIGQLGARQHLLLALLSAWLILTSPWVHMFRRVPRNAGFLELAHVWLGVAALLLAIPFTFSCLRRGGWRQYFPWLSGRFSQVMRELRGLTRREVPSAEGGGLFSLIEGLLLLALLATTLSGAGWLLAQGSAEAVSWREVHILAARGMMVLLLLHIVSVSLHLLDFIGE